MKLHEIKNKLNPDKHYVYSLDTHKVVSGPYDTHLHAVNGPEMGSVPGALVVRLGKKIEAGVLGDDRCT